MPIFPYDHCVLVGTLMIETIPWCLIRIRVIYKNYKNVPIIYVIVDPIRNIDETLGGTLGIYSNTFLKDVFDNNYKYAYTHECY